MRTHPRRPETIVAVDCNERAGRILRSSSLSAGSYGCKRCHKGRIVSGDNRQNENKSLRNKEIQQRKKKMRSRHRSGLAWILLFPDFPATWTAGSWPAMDRNECNPDSSGLEMGAGC